MLKVCQKTSEKNVKIVFEITSFVSPRQPTPLSMTHCPLYLVTSQACGEASLLTVKPCFLWDSLLLKNTQTAVHA